METQTDQTPRLIHDHKTNTANDHLVLEVLDAPGAGGANHNYRITGFQVPVKTLDGVESKENGQTLISFQNGPIKEAGVNGLTQEVLLAIVIDRLRSFQAGQYACRENAIALTKCEESLMWLQKRTLDRVRRGVEGTHQK